MKKLTDEDQQALLAALESALAVYNWRAGRDPDTPAGQRRLLDELLANRAGAKESTGPKPITPEAAQEIEELRAWLREFERPRQKQPRIRLSKISRELKRLRERWRELPFETQCDIGLPPGKIQTHPDGTESFVPLEPSDEQLIEADKANLLRGVPGRPRDAADELLRVVVELWSDYSSDRGIARRGSAGDFDQRYAGPMLDFTVELLDRHAIPYSSRGALGESLYKLRSEIDKRLGINRAKKSRQNKPPPKPH